MTAVQTEAAMAGVPWEGNIWLGGCHPPGVRVGRSSRTFEDSNSHVITDGPADSQLDSHERQACRHSRACRSTSCGQTRCAGPLAWLPTAAVERTGCAKCSSGHAPILLRRWIA
jgi:hypothetical protein